MSDQSKAIGKSVSLPEGLWNTIDKHAASDPSSGDRSSYIQRLVTADLQAAGKLPGSPAEKARQKAEAVILAFANPEDASAAFDGLLLTAARKKASRRRIKNAA